MKRIYAEDAVVEAVTDEDNELLLKYMNALIEAEENLSEESFKIFSNTLHNDIRKYFNLPNKMFTLVTGKDNDSKVYIILLPKKPDGNVYKPLYDKELNKLYIEVEETSSCMGILKDVITKLNNIE